jgi:hypothetical protein
MPRSRIPKGRITPGYKMPKAPGFFSTKVKPEGASIGNFIDNTKRAIAPIREKLSQGAYKLKTPERKIPNQIIAKAPVVIKRKKVQPKKMPMNYKNPNYKPSSGVGVGM